MSDTEIYCFAVLMEKHDNQSSQSRCVCIVIEDSKCKDSAIGMMVKQALLENKGFSIHGWESKIITINNRVEEDNPTTNDTLSV